MQLIDRLEHAFERVPEFRLVLKAEDSLGIARRFEWTPPVVQGSPFLGRLLVLELFVSVLQHRLQMDS